MSRTSITFFLAGLLVLVTSAVYAHPNQPAMEPPAGQDHGVYSLQDRTFGAADPTRAIAYDNFSQSQAYNLTAIRWTGIYAEPFPANLSDTDFVVSIWGDAGGLPDLSSPVKSWTFFGGANAVQSGPDLTVTANGDTNPTTPTTPGGGDGFDYRAPINFQLGAGKYWISIIADQTFDNPQPIVDPSWQWHLGKGPGDGFYFEDLELNQPLTKDGTEGKDLAFIFEGTVVPEPHSAVLAALGFLLVGTLRRRR